MRTRTAPEVLPSDISPEAVAARLGLPGIEPEPRSHGLLKRAVGVAAIGLVSLGALHHFDQSGEYEHFVPTVNRPVQIDNTVRFGSWNMRGQARTRTQQVDKIFNEEHLDAMALQEVTADDARTLHKRLPMLHEVFVEADPKQHVLDGGYGDVLLTRQDPQDIQTRSFPGTGLVTSAINGLEGFGQDLVSGNSSLYYTKQGMQENRAAVAETIKVETAGKLVDMRIITSHIAGVQTVHQNQLHELLQFIGDNNVGSRLTVFCGDMNTDSAAAIPALANLRMITPNTSATSVDGGGTIDHCSYYDNGAPGLGSVQVLKSPITDHRPIIFTLDLPA